MNRLGKKNQENNSMHNSLKLVKCLGINLMKEMKELYNKNYKTSKKKIEENTTKWKVLLH
jgi:cell division protein ZapA (FtsZ GTPase activity inhibitor)